MCRNSEGVNYDNIVVNLSCSGEEKGCQNSFPLNNYGFQETRQSSSEMQTNKRNVFNNEDPHQRTDISDHS